MTLVRRETLKRYTPHRCAGKEQGFTHGRLLAVYLFFSGRPLEGIREKGRRCSVEEGTFGAEGLHIPRYYHYPLFI